MACYLEEAPDMRQFKGNQAGCPALSLLRTGSVNFAG